VNLFRTYGIWSVVFGVRELININVYSQKKQVDILRPALAIVFRKFILFDLSWGRVRSICLFYFITKFLFPVIHSYRA
jgi:hypothetical protein